MVWASCALGFAIYNASTVAKTQMYDTLSALLMAVLVLQLAPRWGALLVAPPLISVLVGQGLQQLLATPWPC
jgi:hypothetical protein